LRIQKNAYRNDQQKDGKTGDINRASSGNMKDEKEETDRKSDVIGDAAGP
jgi:hypothetical protein